MSRTAVTHLPSCFNGFPGAVLHLSAGGRVVESNGRLERELGRGLIGELFSGVLDIESCGDKWDRILMATRATGEPATCELVLANGDAILEPKSFSVLWDAESSFVWLIEHPSDRRMDTVRQQVIEVNSELATTQRGLVRERARLAQSLADTERRNRALDEFSHAISHYLKAPLRSVATHAWWVEKDLGDRLTDESRAHMEVLRSQVERMLTMIGAVSEYSRPGRTRMSPQVVSTSAILEEVIALLDPPATVTIETASDMPTFTSEPAALRQVLLNLIGNAIKHSRRPDPHVWVSARDAGHAYHFAVRDNGPGISLRAQDKIWMLFHSLSPGGADDDGDGGTGIGLAVVRHLVDLHGGKAWVESEEGKGATFHFLWPKQMELQAPQ